MDTSRTLARLGSALGLFFKHTKIGRTIVFLSLPLAILTVALWKPEHKPPIFDAQVHYNQESWDRVSVKAILNTANEVNVPWLLVGSLPNEGTWRLHRGDPARVIPMLIPYHTREQRETWFADPKMQSYIEDEIRSRKYRGIGEFFLFDGQVDTPVVRRMVELAQEHRMVLHARSDANAIRQLFALGPDLRIIWAHGGMFTPPGTIGEMLGRYPRLWVEISHRGDVAPGDTLDPEWREIMLRHPNRFLLGSGTYNERLWYQFRYYFERYRKWLKTLPPGVAESIAFRNGVELFGLNYFDPEKK